MAALGRGLRWAEALALGAGRVRDTSSDLDGFEAEEFNYMADGQGGG